jgi:hypothetical protein
MKRPFIRIDMFPLGLTFIHYAISEPFALLQFLWIAAVPSSSVMPFRNSVDAQRPPHPSAFHGVTFLLPPPGT